MRISQAVAAARDITVKFEGAELRVTYRPLNYTVRQMDEMAAEQERAGAKATRRILETITKLILRWDLTDEYDRLISLDGDIDDPENPLRDVPSHIFTEIIKAVNEDQQPGGAATSGAR